MTSARQDPIRFLRYDCNNDNEPKQVVDVPLSLFWEYLGQHDEGPKDGLAWAPGWITPGKRRRGVNVESFDVLAFDLDHMSAEQFVGCRANVVGLEHLLYTTYSHDPGDGNYSARIVFSLSRRVQVTEYRTLWQSVVRRYKLSPDKKAKDPSRLFFTPRCPKGAQRINEYSSGEPLDVDTLLLEELKNKRDAYVNAEPLPQRPLEEGAVDTDELRRCLQRYNPLPENDPDGNKRALIRRIYNGEKLSDKPGRGNIGSGRGSAAVQAGAILGWILPLGTPVDAVAELVRASVSATPRYEDDGENDDTPEVCFQKLLKYYEESAKSKVAQEAEKGNVVAWMISKAMKPGSFEVPASAIAAAQPLSAQEEGAEPEATEHDDAWRLLCHFDPKTGMPRGTSSNVEIVLRCHPKWRGALRFNELTKEVECVGGPLDPRHRAPERLAVAVQNWLQLASNGLCMVLPLQVVKDQLLHVARDNNYNPVAQYLLSVAWDGTPRIDTFLETYCNAHLEEDGRDISRYVRLVSARWFIGAVARGLNPGCQMDNVLVIEGLEGLKKSSVFRALGGKFFSDSRIKLDDKDSKLLAGRTWIVELAELSAIKKTETEGQKAFLSARHDDFRVPYGHVIERFPRPCVFVGTTNEEDYLTSSTGNRRFWIVHCEKKVDLAAVEVARDQLWAEAVFRWAQKEPYWFEPEEWAEFTEIVNARLADNTGVSTLVESIFEWWAGIDPKQRPDDFSMTDVLVEALKYEKNQLATIGGGVMTRVGRALSKVGFERFRKRTGQDLSWRYKPSDELTGLPKGSSRRRMLRLIASSTPPETPEGGTTSG